MSEQAPDICSFCGYGTKDRHGLVRGTHPDKPEISICDVCLCMAFEALSLQMGVPAHLLYETLKFRHAEARVKKAMERSVADPGEPVSVAQTGG